MYLLTKPSPALTQVHRSSKAVALCLHFTSLCCSLESSFKERAHCWCLLSCKNHTRNICCEILESSCLVDFVAQPVKKIRLQCRRPGFDSWVGKIPCRRQRLLTPVFWPGESHGLYIPWVAKSQKLLSDFTFTFIVVYGSRARVIFITAPCSEPDVCPLSCFLFSYLLPY